MVPMKGHISLISAAICGLALVSAPASAQTGSYDGQPRLIKASQPAGFQKTARATQRVRLVRELDMLRQRVMVEGLLARMEMDTDRRLADMDAVAWRFDRILDGFERGDAELGLDGARDTRLVRQISRARAAWSAVAAVVLDVQRAGRVEDSHVQGLSRAGAWLDLEIGDLIKHIEHKARMDGAVAGNPETTVAAQRREKILRQMMSQYLVAENDRAAGETR